MHVTKTVNIVAALLLGLVLSGSYPVALAQGDDIETEQPQTSPKKTEMPKKSTPDNKTTDPINDDSPFDYEASEEISQDLSVSFPVDI